MYDIELRIEEVIYLYQKKIIFHQEMKDVERMKF